MRFETIIPTTALRPFIRKFVLSENEQEQTYKVFPGTGLVMGFQYSGRLCSREKDGDSLLATAGITGIHDHARSFISVAKTGTVLVYFTETGLGHFSSPPANDLFNQSVSLEHLFDKDRIQQTEEMLSIAVNDQQKIGAIEKFFLSQLKDFRGDGLVTEAIRLIRQHKGNIRISELSKKLFISQSPLEKRFRKIVGTTPRKFASIVRFNTVLKDMNGTKTLAEICYENDFFDQAHFIHDFRHFTGTTPEQFRKC